MDLDCESAPAGGGGERSMGYTIRRLDITKTGNGRMRRALIESAWTCRHLPRTSKLKYYVHEQLPLAVRDIAMKAQAHLRARYRALTGLGKKLTVAVTAIARELAGFIWAIGRAVQTALSATLYPSRGTRVVRPTGRQHLPNRPAEAAHWSRPEA
jgi:hypothetical protein